MLMGSRVIKKTAVVLALAFAMIEVGVRAVGLNDFPCYATDNEIGYIPKPSQSGRFLRRNSWVFNDRSMGVAENWSPLRRPNILLIGNSIVMGGDPFDQTEKIGPLIQQRLGDGFSVWPISAGGWSNVNEGVYLKRNPDIVLATHFFVWEYMRGGLSGLNTWQSDYVFPRDRPLCASCYFFHRYFVPLLRSKAARPRGILPPTGSPTLENVGHFEKQIVKLREATRRATPGVLLLYPSKAEYLKAREGGEWLSERPELETICKENGLIVVDLTRYPEWNQSLYRDGVHPTAEGNIVLSKILSNAITEGLRQPRMASRKIALNRRAMQWR
jgi:hypothetical protein